MSRSRFEIVYEPHPVPSLARKSTETDRELFIYRIPARNPFLNAPSSYSDQIRRSKFKMAPALRNVVQHLHNPRVFGQRDIF